MIFWSRKTRATARDVVADTSPAETTLATAVAWYFVSVLLRASLDWVKLRRNDGVEVSRTTAKSRSRWW